VPQRTLRANASRRRHRLRAGRRGGPKGLALIPLDRRLFDPARGWLRHAALELVGASIGAWRMAAAAMPEPLAALDRLADAYVGQTYPHRPSPREVTEQCRRLARAVLGGAPAVQARPGRALSVVTARARGALERGGRGGVRPRRARQHAVAPAPGGAPAARRVHRGGARFPSAAFDRFGLDRVALEAGNSEDALLASGSIPLLCEPVRNPQGAPRGEYWTAA